MLTKKNLKRNLLTTFFTLRRVRYNDKLIRLINQSDIIPSYNDIMNDCTHIECILIGNTDKILIHHLIMFGDRMGIEVYGVDGYSKVCGVRDAKEILKYIEKEGDVYKYDIYKEEET